MAQQINVNIRMDSDLKQRADILFRDLGFNLTTAINAFVRQAIREEAIPFQIKKTQKRQSLSQYLEEYHNKPIETILKEAETNNSDIENTLEIDWGEPRGEEKW